MTKSNTLFLIILGALLFSCGSNSGKRSSYFTLKIQEKKKEFRLGDRLQISLENKKDKAIDSVQYYFQHKRISGAQPLEISLHLKEVKLGNHPLEAIVFYEGKSDTASTNIRIYHDASPVSYTYKIIKAFPHDRNAYTQGLEFHGDTLYESTGQYGSSSLRKVDLKSGEVLQKVDLPKEYFGEGLTILNQKIYQLTWNEGEGFIYDLNSFQRTGSFSYNQSEEGWGLCNDGEKLYKSDGTEKIWILDPDDLAEEDFIQVATHKSLVSKMNELEWVEGKIYANTYQKDGVAIINPTNGAIEGLIDFRGLRDQVTQHDRLDVLNGIAWNPETEKLYITGKNWDKIFEVEIIRK